MFSIAQNNKRSKKMFQGGRKSKKKAQEVQTEEKKVLTVTSYSGPDYQIYIPLVWDLW
jgi:hypothetical protein